MLEKVSTDLTQSNTIRFARVSRRSNAAVATNRSARREPDACGVRVFLVRCSRAAIRLAESGECFVEVHLHVGGYLSRSRTARRLHRIRPETTSAVSRSRTSRRLRLPQCPVGGYSTRRVLRPCAAGACRLRCRRQRCVGRSNSGRGRRRTRAHTRSSRSCTRSSGVGDRLVGRRRTLDRRISRFGLEELASYMSFRRVGHAKTRR